MQKDQNQEAESCELSYLFVFEKWKSFCARRF